MNQAFFPEAFRLPEPLSPDILVVDDLVFDPVPEESLFCGRSIDQVLIRCPPPNAHDHDSRNSMSQRSSWNSVPDLFSARRMRTPSGRSRTAPPSSSPLMMSVDSAPGEKAAGPVTFSRMF